MSTGSAQKNIKGGNPNIMSLFWIKILLQSSSQIMPYIDLNARQVHILCFAVKANITFIVLSWFPLTARKIVSPCLYFCPFIQNKGADCVAVCDNILIGFHISRYKMPCVFFNLPGSVYPLISLHLCYLTFEIGSHCFVYPFTFQKVPHSSGSYNSTFSSSSTLPYSKCVYLCTKPTR